ncbi:MAG: thioredoxin family protein [Caldilineaceae bacterium]|nr:thioredoxin family protein [Caldilineaceae bacterium]
MLERFLILALAALLFALIMGGWRRWQTVRLRRLQTRDLPSPLTALLDGTRPTLLYFTADHCVQCKLQQTPILEQLRQLIDVPVHTIDAVSADELTQYFGVMTVPTTVVLDGQRRATAVNHGLAPLPKLQAQLASAA